MGYGVIGNTKVSGSFVLGSSPGIPANLHMEVAAPSYSGLVLRPLTAATPVQIRLGSPLGKKLSSRKAGELFLFIYLFVSYLLLWGAAVSLSRRRSLRRGTPGHDEIPRALGIMRPHHRDTPVGVTTREKPGFFGSRAFLFISASVGKPFRFYCAARTASKSHKCFEKPPLWLLFETQVASRRQ